MKKKYIIILISILGIITFCFGIKSINEFSVSSNKIEEKNKNSIKSRDGIVGVKQPFPFLKNSKEVENNLLENAKNSIEDQFILLQKNNLPVAEQKLFANNKDSKQYILGYLLGKKSKIYEEGETVKLNRKYPYYVQWDRRWSYDKLGDINIAIGGCGPATVSMAISGLLNDNSITPDKIAKIADENGYGTSELIPLNSYKNGLTAEYLAYYLRQDSFVEYIKDKVTGAKMPRVAMDILRNIDIIKPNYISQEQFSSFVNHINKLKFA